MSTEDEKDFIYKEINEIKFNENYFKVWVDGIEGKRVIGAISPKEKPIDKIFMFRSIYTTVLSLHSSIHFSLEQALNYSYHEKVNSIDNFSMFGESHSSEEEFLAYYFLENAIFRLSSLWDMFAQFYNTYYDLGIDKRKLYYKKLFEKLSVQHPEFQQILEYLNEKDDPNMPSEKRYKADGKWEGNHEYLNEYRNRMTHVSAPNISMMSNYEFNFKDHPVLILKRTADEFLTVCTFIQEALEKM